MTRDDIIRMAAACGIPEYEDNESQADNIIRFANLVAAAEREACARMVEPVDESLADEIRARTEAKNS